MACELANDLPVVTCEPPMKLSDANENILTRSWVCRRKEWVHSIALCCESREAGSMQAAPDPGCASEEACWARCTAPNTETLPDINIITCSCFGRVRQPPLPGFNCSVTSKAFERGTDL